MFVSFLREIYHVFHASTSLQATLSQKGHILFYQMSIQGSGMFLNLTNFRAENYPYNRIWRVVQSRKADQRFEFSFFQARKFRRHACISINFESLELFSFSWTHVQDFHHGNTKRTGVVITSFMSLAFQVFFELNVLNIQCIKTT